MVAGAAGLKDLIGWYKTGQLRAPETVVEGLDAAPAAFAGTFGDNAHVGKLLVKLA